MSPDVAVGTWSFHEFVTAVRPRYIWYEHCLRLAAVLQRVADDELFRVMVFEPPRHGKSEEISRLFAAYYLYRHPERFVGLNSYAAELAYTFSRSARDNFQRGGGVTRSGVSAVKHWETGSGGGLWAAGVGGPIFGKGFSLGIIDDPVKNAEEAGSEVIRVKHKDWYASTFLTRAEPNAAIVVVQTRWHDDDLSGWLLSQDEEEAEGWHVVNFEAIKTALAPTLPTSVTVEPDWREPGTALCPERYPLAKLEKIQRRIGSFFFAALYQQSPMPREGGMFKRSWWKRYRQLPTLTRIEQYVDSAFKEGIENDYSVIATWGTDGLGNYYLIDLWRARVAYPDLMRAIHDQHAKHATGLKLAIVIEDKASGQSALQTLRRPMPTLSGEILPALPVIPFPAPDNESQKKIAAMSKVARAEGVTPLVESGHVFLPESAPWVDDFISEHERFPLGAHDDQVDTTSMALIRLPRTGVRAY